MLFLDLDHFKAVNDQYGHAVGDRLLKFFANAVVGVLRAGDTFGRLSGDEFLLALAETGAPPLTEELEARIRDALAAGLTLDSGQVLRPGVSIGVVVYPEEAATLEDLLSLADQRMYAAKARRASDALAKNQSGPQPERA